MLHVLQNDVLYAVCFDSIHSTLHSHLLREFACWLTRMLSYWDAAHDPSWTRKCDWAQQKQKQQTGEQGWPPKWGATPWIYCIIILIALYIDAAIIWLDGSTIASEDYFSQELIAACTESNGWKLTRKILQQRCRHRTFSFSSSFSRTGVGNLEH